MAGLIQTPLDVPAPSQRELSPPVNPSLTELSPDRMRAVLGIPPPSEAAAQPPAQVDVESMSPAELLGLAGKIFFAAAKDQTGLIEAMASLLKAIKKYADDQMSVDRASVLRLPVPVAALPPTAGEVGMPLPAPALPGPLPLAPQSLTPQSMVPPMMPAPPNVTDPRLALLQRLGIA